MPEPGVEVCKWQPRLDEEITRSVDTLKELYTVAVAVALTLGVEKLATLTECNGCTPLLQSEAFVLFLVFFVTLIPFYHGASRHMDDIYVFRETRPGAVVLLLDYILLMVEAGSLVWLGENIGNRVTFTKCYLFLLALDVLWAIITGTFTAAGKSVRSWALLNSLALVIVLAVFHPPYWTPWKPCVLLLLAFVRSALDYRLCRNLYFPHIVKVGH